MTTAPRIALRIDGRPRSEPLAPVGVLAEGEAASALVRRALAALDAAEPDASTLLGVGLREPEPLVVLLGAPDALPWVEGVRYVGIDRDAPRLRLSTTHAPTLHDGTPFSASILERAVVAQLGPKVRGPFVVVARDGAPRAISLAAARPIDRATLLAFLGPETEVRTVSVA